MLLASGRMAASAKGHSRSERASSLEKKRSDDRNDFVRKFLMEGQFALGQSLDSNIWQSCHGLDFGARARRRLITVDDQRRPTRLLRQAEKALAACDPIQVPAGKPYRSVPRPARTCHGKFGREAVT